MSSSKLQQQAHVVLLPFPSQGHIMAMMRLSKLLHSIGCYITFINTEFNHQRLIRSKGPESVAGLPDFKFETIPDGLPQSDGDDEDTSREVTILIDSVRKTCLEPLKKLLVRINSTPDVPKISKIVVDGVMTFGVRAARELEIPDVVFWTASVCSFIAFLHFPELVTRGICPFKNDDYLTDGTLDNVVDWMTGLVDIPMKDLPSFMRITDPNDMFFEYLAEESQNCLKSSGLIFNTFYELDKECLETVVTKFNFPNILPIGPLPFLQRHSTTHDINSSLWKPDSKVFEWLDTRKPESVVYVNYGSLATVTSEQLEEFAWGLADSKLPFLWIIRPDLVKDESKKFLEDFLEETKGRGLLASWCAQDDVLLHKSVGAFLTHCGWNSIMESVSAGIPLICWPFFGDQQTNCFYSCKIWGIGMEISHDVKREDVAETVREVMDGDKGKEMRMKAREWQKVAKAATDVKGLSYTHFDKLVEDVIHF